MGHGFSLWVSSLLDDENNVEKGRKVPFFLLPFVLTFCQKIKIENAPSHLGIPSVSTRRPAPPARGWIFVTRCVTGYASRVISVRRRVPRFQCSAEGKGGRVGEKNELHSYILVSSQKKSRRKKKKKRNIFSRRVAVQKFLDQRLFNLLGFALLMIV